NNLGQVVGYSYTATGQYHAFLWQNGIMTDLGTLPGGSYSSAQGINNQGQVAGYSQNANGQFHAFLWQNGHFTDLKTLFGGTTSYAYGIDDSGRVVGYADTPTGQFHAFLYQNASSGMSDIGGAPTPASGFGYLQQANAISHGGNFIAGY